jgi:uncharacterized membrane protein
VSGLVQGVTIATALGFALVAGVFFAFSTFVMPALARLPAAQGVAAMRSINVCAITPSFMAAMFAPLLAGIGLAIWAALSWDEAGAPWLLAGGVLYLLGTIVVTMAANVPMNDALVAMEPESAPAAEYWPRYVRVWNAWNHLRGAAGLAAAALLTVGLVV